MGDLDAIVMRALRKEPDRRYSSVERLVAELPTPEAVADRLRVDDSLPEALRRAAWRALLRRTSGGLEAGRHPE